MKLTLGIAKKFIERSKIKAEEIGVMMSFAVVDAAGHLVVLERMDGAAWITVDIAFGKAYTAIAFRLIGERFKDSQTIGDYFKDTPSFLGGLGVSTSGKIIGRGGGIPIVRNGEVIGAIGLSGGTAAQDHKCAESALREN